MNADFKEKSISGGRTFSAVVLRQEQVSCFLVILRSQCLEKESGKRGGWRGQEKEQVCKS